MRRSPVLFNQFQYKPTPLEKFVTYAAFPSFLLMGGYAGFQLCSAVHAASRNVILQNSINWAAFLSGPAGEMPITAIQQACAASKPGK